MTTRLVFVSCGQITTEEKALGRGIAAVIEKNGMKPFFAEDVHSPEGLNAVVFRHIRLCDAFVAVMHRRGNVAFGNYPASHRASVWIQQEIALVAYRKLLQQRDLPIRVYVEPGIRREGVLEVLIVNPIEFNTHEAVLADLSTWLGGEEFKRHPVLARREASFRRRVSKLSEDHWLILELIAAHCPTPGDFVDQDTLRNDFFEIKRAGAPPTDESNKLIDLAFNDAGAWLEADGLVLKFRDLNRNRYTIGKQWWDLVLDELSGDGRVSPPKSLSG